MALFLLSTCPVEAVRFRHHASAARRPMQLSLRKRLHINDLITAPGTMELDFGGLYSYTTGFWSLPAAVKYTPAGGSLLWGRTEYSLAFDTVDSWIDSGGRTFDFSDRISAAATTVVWGTEHLNVAIAPQVTVLLRGDSGTRLGGSTIARYDGGKHSIGGAASWTGATSATDTNPAGVWDLVGGYGLRLRRFTPHAESIWERATGFQRTVTVSGGVEYQITNRFALDFSGQRIGIAGGNPDRQLLVGMTVNLGNIH